MYRRSALGVLLVLVLSLPGSASAVSGTCSWHGGVNCSIGPDWDGSAICNDGWTDSGERYFEQAICVQIPMCSQYLWQQMSDTPEMQADENKFYELINTINTLNIEYPMIEIRIQEDYVGRGATAGGIAPIIKGEQKKNRDAATKAAYDAVLLDQKLHTTQLQINKTCIASGVADQQSKLKQERVTQTQQYQSAPLTQPSRILYQYTSKNLPSGRLSFRIRFSP